jgi:hypothetical protein
MSQLKCISITNKYIYTCICMYVYYLSIYWNGEAAIAVKTPWGRNANALETPWTPLERCAIAVNALVSPWTPCKRCVIAVQLSCNRYERRVNAVQIAVGHLGVPTATSLRCHDVLGDCIAVSRRSYCVLQRTAIPQRIICSRTQTPSLGVLGDSTAFCGDAMAIPRRCLRST